MTFAANQKVMHIVWMFLTLEPNSLEQNAHRWVLTSQVADPLLGQRLKPARALARRFGSGSNSVLSLSILLAHLKQQRARSAAFRERRPPQQDGVLLWTLRPVILTVKSILIRVNFPVSSAHCGKALRAAGQTQAACRIRLRLLWKHAFGNRWPRASVDGDLGESAVVSRCESTGPYQRRLSVARRQHAAFASSSWRSYAEPDSGACRGSSVTAAATMRR
jgi:hypothetical protein